MAVTGTDTASYVGAATGVYANLLAPSVNNGEAAGDSYMSIENLSGSAGIRHPGRRQPQ